MFDHTKLQVYHRDAFVDFTKATISIGNTGFLYGLGAFTGMRAHYNKAQKQLYLFRPQDHYNRLVGSAKLCRFNDFLKNYSYKKFLGIIKKLLSTNDIHEDSYIRVSLFVDEVAIGPKFGKYHDSMSAYLFPLGDYVPTQGMRCMVSSWRRVEDDSLPARAKLHGAYVNTAFAKTEALENGFDEAIFLNREGEVIEGSAENIFIVRDGVLITPPVNDNILEGITRRSVVTIAHHENISVVERSIDRSELYMCDEVFLTGTGARVSPVVEVDRVAVGNGKIGAISQKIQKIYTDAVIGNNQKYLNWLVAVY